MDTETSIRPDALRPLGTHDRCAREARRHWVRWSASTLALIILGTFLFTRGDRAAVKYVTQEVTRGSLTVTVSATGNVEPRNQVDIGSELSGRVRSVMVDVNDDVMAGQVLAVLDTTRLKAQVLQAESLLASTNAR